MKSVKGRCHWGHKVGDRIEISGHYAGGHYGSCYHDIFPTIIMLQFGGQYPRGDPVTVELECRDRINAITIELQREK